MQEPGNIIGDDGVSSQQTKNIKTLRLKLKHKSLKYYAVHNNALVTYIITCDIINNK